MSVLIDDTRSANVAVDGRERITELPGVERRDHLADTVRDGHQSLEAETRLDLVEAHLIVARILVAADVRHATAIGLAVDLLDEIELAVVLARAPGVENLAADGILGRVEHRSHGARRITHVDVGAPELLSEHLEVAVGPEVAGELVDCEVESHSWSDAVHGRESQARCR